MGPEFGARSKTCVSSAGNLGFDLLHLDLMSCNLCASVATPEGKVT